MDLGSQQANDGPHARVEARRVPLSEHLESTTGVSSTAEFVEESRTRETIPARSKSTVAPSGASGHLRPAARRGDTIKPDAKAEAQNQAAQPLTGADNPRSRAAHAITVSESYSTPLLLDERNLPTIPISPQNVLIARTSRKAGGDGSLSLPEAHEASRSPHAQEDPHREVHATFRVEDRGHSFQSLSGSSPVPSSPLPPGTSSVSSLPSSVPLAAIKRTSSGIRSNKDIPPGELSGRPESIPKSTAYSDTNRGIASAERSHVKRLPDAVPDRVVTAESTSLHQHPSSPRIDRSTSHFQPPIQHHAVSSESSASETASPHHPSLTGVIRRTVSSYPRHRSDDDASRAGGASISDTDRTDGSPSPPTMALSSPRYQPSNKTLADPSASAERSIPHDSLVRKRWDMTDGPSDEKTRKEVSHNSSSTQGRRTSPATETTERHGSNIRDPPSPSRSLAVRQGQGDSTAKRGPSSSTRISKEESQTNMESRTRIKSPPDRIEHNHPSSSQSPSAGQPLSHTDSATYSDIPTRSRTEPSHSESTRPEGAEGGGQTGDGGQPGGTEALRPPPAKARSSPPEKSSKKALEASNARSLLPTLLDSPAIKHREMPASSTASDRSHRTTRKEVLDGDSSTLVRLISPAAEPTEGQGVNARDPSRPPLQSSVVRQGESDPVSKRGPSSSMGISREMSQAITDSRPRIESPLDRVENSLPSSSSSLSKLPPTHTPNSTAHSTIPKIRTEPSRLESLGPDGAGDGGNARDGGQQGSGVPTTTAEALPPTKALPPPPEQPSIETDTNALPPTLLGPPLNKPLMSSSRKEAEDGSLGMQDRRLQPILPAVPAQGHGVSLGEPLSLPPPQSSGVRQGTGDPVAKKEPSSSMGIAREKSQTPMESRTRTKSPQDRIVHTHSLSSSSLSRKPSTRPAPSTTADSSIPTSRSEPSHLESMRPEDVGGSGRSGGGEKQRGPNPRETTEAFPPLPTKTLSSPPEQPSSKNSADPSASTERSSHQHSSAQPQTDRSTSRFQQPNQHDTVSPESFACATATPIPSSLPGGVIRRTGSSHPRHGSENDVSRAGGASVPDTARSLGGLPPPPSKALSSPRDQPSNKNLVDRSAGVEKPYLSAPHDTLANKKGETMDSASDGITLKEVSHSSSTTQGRSLKPTSPAVEPTERHGDNLRDSPPPSHSLSVRQGQGDPAAKRGPSPSTVNSREKSQTPIDSRMRTESPPDCKENSHPSSSQSPSGQTHTQTDGASYSDIPTRSRDEPSNSESTRPEGTGDGGQTGDGGRQARRSPPSGAREVAGTARERTRCRILAPFHRLGRFLRFNCLFNSELQTELQMSFPPHTEKGSAAADFALFMHPSTPWDTAWYASSPRIPPHLMEPLEISYKTKVVVSRAVADIKTVRGVIRFADLSMCWYSVKYGNGSIERWARFLQCPKPMSVAELQRAAESHGAAVAEFAENAVASGQPVDSGECWDVAHEGLKYAASLSGLDDAPVPSTSRAHGHLLFCGKPGMGRWRGGDDRLRRGDIVEWRSVRIRKAKKGAYATLGNPDHTAVLVQDTVPRRVVADGISIKPAHVGVLTVVEQSPGHTPKQNSYDLAKLRAGEVWVYRPVSMIKYLGSTWSIDIPTGLAVCSSDV